MDKLYPFTRFVSHIPLPEQFTYPFHYTPHPLCVEAAEEVQRYLAGCEGADEGKMFGVLVVRAADGTVGFLAAFSGIWAGSYRHAYFVPPVYDLQEPNGFFARGERELDALNRKVRVLEEAPALVACRQRLEAEKRQSEQELEALKARMKADKARRDCLRVTATDAAAREALIRESQFQKAELRRRKQAWAQRLAALQAEVEGYEAEIRQLREERKHRSAALQQELFTHFRMHNARGEVCDLCRIFADTDRKVPPAGAGECAAPKLLQYAYLHGLHPLAMAEFWWGCPPKNELRRQGCYYPACKEKCEPILRFMLQGLSVEPNPLQANASQGRLELEVLYEDDDLMVVHKPAGLLSVPGKLDTFRLAAYPAVLSRGDGTACRPSVGHGDVGPAGGGENEAGTPKLTSAVPPSDGGETLCGAVGRPCQAAGRRDFAPAPPESCRSSASGGRPCAWETGRHALSGLGLRGGRPYARRLLPADGTDAPTACPCRAPVRSGCADCRGHALWEGGRPTVPPRRIVVLHPSCNRRTAHD